MNDKDKKFVMNAVLDGTLKNVQDTLENHNLVLDENFFDYELLKAALRRKHQGIINYLILKKGCRVRNPNVNNLNEETPLHLAMELNKIGFIQKILIRGASIYDKNHAGDIPVYAAFKKGYFCAIEDLLHHSCRLKNLDPKNKDDVLHFHIACVIADLHSVKVYLASGFYVNSPLSLDAGEYLDLNGRIFSNSFLIYSGMTPLHFAAMYGFEEMVQLLLKNGANSNKADKKGRTPVHSVILGKTELEEFEIEEKDLRTKIIKMLLEKKARLDVADKDGCTPLHIAFYYGNSEDKKNIFDILLSNVHWGPRPTNDTDHQGLSYFHIACTTNDVNQIEQFLVAGVDISSCVTSGIYSGYTPLHFAVLHNQRKVVELLLKSNAEVNVKTTEMQVSPLHLACEYNYVKFQELNSNFDWASQSDKTINIDWTSNCENQLIIIKLLLLHGADTEIRDSTGKTPLLHAGKFDFCHHCKLDWSNSFKQVLSNELEIRLEKIIGTLLFNKANVNSRTNNQSSLLHIFSENSFLKISDDLIKFLVNKGLDIDAVDDTGLTPLHVAVKSDNMQMVETLLKYKANVNAVSYNGMIPLQISIKNYLKHAPVKKDILCVLLENGSEVDLINKNDRTLLSDAIAERNIFVLAKLLQYGADINLKSSSGKSSVFFLYKWRATFSDWKELKYATLFQIIFIHVQKLLALRLHVCKKVQKCCTDLYPLYQKALPKSHQLIDLDGIYDDCTKELNEMKLIKVDNYTSLYNILLKDCTALTKHVKNGYFMETINGAKIEDLFPFYGYLLKVQFKKGLIRSCALKSAKPSLDRVLGLNLPDSCYDLVIKHLTNEDVANLNAAASVKNSNDGN